MPACIRQRPDVTADEPERAAGTNGKHQAAGHRHAIEAFLNRVEFDGGSGTHERASALGCAANRARQRAG
jgi:hypothetical protein